MNQHGWSMDPAPLLAAWPDVAGHELRPTGSGVNNHSWYVGDRYVLRVYRNTADRARVDYEHRVLRALDAAGLSFRVPAPVPTREGDTLAAAEGGALAALFLRLPGEPPDRTNPAHVRSCGAALGELHKTMRRLEVGPPPREGTYGDLDRVHRLVPDPWRIGDALPLPAQERARLNDLLGGLREAVPALYRGLPFQLCHCDYGPGNTLQVGGRTSAVLDFEFAAPDVRAIDVACGWYWGVRNAWAPGGAMPIIRAFLEGYGPLSEAEAWAMPTLGRLQRATALVHRLGRQRAGLDGMDTVIEHAQRLLDLDAWLDAHGDELVAIAGGTR